MLDDPNRHLSKSHCAIEFDGGEFLVTDTSTNGVFVNQAPERLGRGNTMGLRDGDVIGFGESLLHVPLLNIVGEQATWHLELDAPGTSDLAGHARLCSNWVETSTSAEDLGRCGTESVEASLEGAGKIATLIVPAKRDFSPEDAVRQARLAVRTDTGSSSFCSL